MILPGNECLIAREYCVPDASLLAAPQRARFFALVGIAVRIRQCSIGAASRPSAPPGRPCSPLYSCPMDREATAVAVVVMQPPLARRQGIGSRHAPHLSVAMVLWPVVE